MSLTITNIDQGSLFIGTPTVQDDTLTFAGADTLVRGTILARDSVSGKLVIFAAGGPKSNPEFKPLWPDRYPARKLSNWPLILAG